MPKKDWEHRDAIDQLIANADQIGYATLYKESTAALEDLIINAKRIERGEMIYLLQAVKLGVSGMVMELRGIAQGVIDQQTAHADALNEILNDKGEPPA